jgi:hypothetical protein
LRYLKWLETSDMFGAVQRTESEKDATESIDIRLLRERTRHLATDLLHSVLVYQYARTLNLTQHTGASYPGVPCDPFIVVPTISMLLAVAKSVIWRSGITGSSIGFHGSLSSTKR